MQRKVNGVFVDRYTKPLFGPPTKCVLTVALALDCLSWSFIEVQRTTPPAHLSLTPDTVEPFAGGENSMAIRRDVDAQLHVKWRK